jgi:DNA-binding NarL/FixJ family response regulator
LLLLAQGNTDGGVAAAIGISVGTARKHRQHILEKTQTHNAAELVHTALRYGWLMLQRK